MKDKKGQGLPTSTIILIIVGVVILVLLIFGVTAGWDNIKGWLGNDNNIDEVVGACKVACAQNSVYDWCTKTMNLRVKGEKITPNTCKVYSGNTLFVKEYGFEDCPELRARDGC